MNKYSIVGVIVGLTLGYFIFNDSKSIERAYGQCEVVRDDYVTSLERANETIDELNNQIEDAQSNAWASYQEMGEVLENLQTMYQEDDPGTICR